MDKILLALAELKNFLTAKADNETKVATAQASLATAQGDLASANTLLVVRDATIAKLTADLATANGALTASTAALATVTAAAATETQRTDETLAALGVDPKTIPAAAAPGAKKSENSAVVEAYNAITHPGDRIAFYRKNKTAIDATFRD
ncbi:MAG: hypothetical protein PHQ12_11425 [Chthoniobacteraceae bacterium]|nr:hypothetical protein [Chthoniobacteraceae bacterium]